MKISLVSSFHDIPDEIHVLNLLFCNGLTTFHLRKDLECKHLGGKDTYTEEKIRNYIESIYVGFRDRIILHSHFHLVKEYGLLGGHFTKKYTYSDFLSDHGLDSNDRPFSKVGFSLHSAAEILEYTHTYDYFFLSPIFDSISNVGYRSKFDLGKLKKFIQTEEINSEIMALGGMNTNKVTKIKDLGFSGLCLLGFIWSEFDENRDIAAAVQKFKKIIEIKNTTPSE